MTHTELAIDYVREHVDMDRVDITRGYMYLHRTPLNVEDAELCDTIYDLMEEYGADNNLPEGWWLHDMDEEDVLFRITRNDNINY